MVYNGCKEDFVEDKINSNIALNFDIFISLFAALFITGIFVITDFISVVFSIIPNLYLGTFAFFVTIFVSFMVVLYLPGFKYQDKCLGKIKVSRPFYFIMEFDKDMIELKVDFDKDHRRTNKQYKIYLNTVESIGIYNKELLDDNFIHNGDFVKVEDTPDVEFIKINTNKIGSLSNIGNRKLSYIIPRYDDNGVDMLIELKSLVGE